MSIDGPAFIKAGPNLGDVVEFYGVFLNGILLINRFKTYAEAERFYNERMAER
jgi:hypothetical protein